MVQIKSKKIRIFRRAHVLYSEPLEFTEYYDKRLSEEDIQKCDEILLDKMREMYAELTDILTKKKKVKKQ